MAISVNTPVFGFKDIDVLDKINEKYAKELGRGFLSTKSTVKSQIIEDLPILFK